MAEIVVSNSSPLIALHQIRQLELLQILYGQVFVPPAVVGETAPQFAKPSWLVETPIASAMIPRITARSIGAGETEALALALEMDADLAILDERAGRNLAQSLGIHVTGALGILIFAKQQGLLTAVRPLVEALQANDFYISSPLFDEVMLIAGESP